jgi:predicted secreted protein
MGKFLCASSGNEFLKVFLQQVKTEGAHIVTGHRLRYIFNRKSTTYICTYVQCTSGA